jgi:parvulin-like peptidyl-prolyl isomerase
MKKQAVFAVLMILAGGPACAQERVIATVNADKITAGDLTKKMWWQYSAQSLSDIIDERLLLAEAARLKVSYDASEAEKRFANLSAGYKDKKEFETSLKTVGWTPAAVQDLIKRQMLSKNTVIAAKNIRFTDADIKAAFEQNKSKLGKPDSLKLRQIFVATKAEADEAYQILTAGADFAKLSALKSADEDLKKREGDIGEVAKGQMQPELEKEIFALKPGQYTRAIATGNGFSLFKAEAFKPSEPAVLTDALKAGIKAELINQAVVQKLPELAAELRQKAKIEIIK